MVPPGGVNFTALDIRFSSTCLILRSSPRNGGRSGGRSIFAVKPPADKGLEARLIEPVTRDDGKRGREEHDPDQPGALSRAKEGDYRRAALHCLFSSKPVKDRIDSLSLHKRRVARCSGGKPSIDFTQ